MRVVAWIIFIVSGVAVPFCGYSFIFWTWVCATPLTRAQLARAQYNSNAWLGLTAVSVAVAVVSLLWAIRLGRRKVISGFDVVQRNTDPGQRFL